MDKYNKNSCLETIKKLNELLMSHPSSKKTYEYLRVLASRSLTGLQLSESDEYVPEKLSRQDIYALAIGEPVSQIESGFAKDKVDIRAVKKELERFINKQPNCEEAFRKLGYIPVIRQSKPVKGAGNKTLYWLDIEPFNATDHSAKTDIKLKKENLSKSLLGKSDQTTCSISEDDNDNENEDINNNDWFAIEYERLPISKVKPSLFSKIFFKNGELEMLSFRGISLMIFMIISLLLEIFIVLTLIIVVIYMKEVPSFSFYSAFVTLAILLLSCISFTWRFKPLHHLMTHRVSKAPELFTSINTDNADIEMYKGSDGYRIARITAFVSTCPICTAPIELADGKPDQRAPLVGRCREAPHAHVYSFDRMTLKGYFLGHEGYLRNLYRTYALSQKEIV